MCSRRTEFDACDSLRILRRWGLAFSFKFMLYWPLVFIEKGGRCGKYYTFSILYLPQLFLPAFDGAEFNRRQSALLNGKLRPAYGHE